MFRYLIVHLPGFRLERCGWESHQLAMLVAEERRALRVLAATPAAQRLGVRVGMSAAEARALVPELNQEILDPEAERQDLEALAEQLLKLSPSVSTLPPEALVAEVRGNAGEPGGERVILERARVRLGALGHQVRLAIADDPVTALAVASWGRRDQIVPAGQSAAALAPLPLEAIGLPAAELGLLHGLGVRTVGAFAALPPAAVSGRLGPLGAAAHALARGSGPARPVAPRADGADLCRTIDLPDPVVELDALVFVLNATLRDISADLAASGRAAVRVSLRFRLDDGGEQELSVRLGEPTRDSRRILATLRQRLEGYQLAGPVAALSVEVPEPVGFHGKQRNLMDWRTVGDALDEVMARLQDQLGEEAVSTPRLVSRHRPEAEWAPLPWRGASGARGGGGRASAAAQLAVAEAVIADDPVRAWEGHPSPALPDRPPILLPLPLAIDVATGPDHRPAAIHHEGRWIDLRELSGPELLSGEWWQRGFHREYYRARLADGRQAWIYREDGRWALHGWWDR